MAISLTSPLLGNEGFRHGFSTRENDLRLDSPGAAHSLARFAEDVKIAPERIRQAKQVHGARALEAQSGVILLEEADALISRGTYAVGIRVADCVPLLVADRQRGHVAAIHAGWRGLVAGVIDHALELLGGERGDLVCAIGPHIGPCCFEVGEEVRVAVARYVGDEEGVVRLSPGAKPYVDLRVATHRALRRAGLRSEAIDDVLGCTACDAARFFSYRREKEASGRHLALIAPKDRP